MARLATGPEAVRSEPVVKPDRDKVHGAAVVEEALLVSSPGYGIIDWGAVEH